MRPLHWKLVGLVLAVVAAVGVSAEPKLADPSLAELNADLNRLTMRVEQLEQQLAQLAALRVDEAKPDRYGVLRDSAGREVGVWGAEPSAIPAKKVEAN